MKPVTYKAVAAVILENLSRHFSESEVRWFVRELSRMHRAAKTQDPARHIVRAMLRLEARSSRRRCDL